MLIYVISFNFKLASSLVIQSIFLPINIADVSLANSFARFLYNIDNQIARIFKNNFIYLFLATVGLPCCTDFLSLWLPLVVVHGWASRGVGAQAPGHTGSVAVAGRL